MWRVVQHSGTNLPVWSWKLPVKTRWQSEDSHCHWLPLSSGKFAIDCLQSGTQCSSAVVLSLTAFMLTSRCGLVVGFYLADLDSIPTASHPIESLVASGKAFSESCLCALENVNLYPSPLVEAHFQLYCAYVFNWQHNYVLRANVTKVRLIAMH